MIRADLPGCRDKRGGGPEGEGRCVTKELIVPFILRDRKEIVKSERFTNINDRVNSVYL